VPTCPFCGAAETDRFDLEGHRFLVFACMFTPEVDPALSDAEIGSRLQKDFVEGGSKTYFRGMCDRLHYFVTAGAGARALNPAGMPAPDGATEPPRV
jgi:hypothetical protein